MRKTFLLLAAMLIVSAASAQKIPSEKDMGAYLFTYFNDPTHSLFMAVSYDGYTFKAVNESKPIISGDSIADQRGIRDPHIYRGPDGWFYIAMTDLHVFGKQRGLRSTQWERDDKYGWGNNRGLVLMKSKDLIHWTHTEVRIDQRFPEEFGELGCAWAPEIIYDPSVGKMMVYFTIRKEAGGRTKLYYSYANDEFTDLVTEPKLLFEYPDEMPKDCLLFVLRETDSPYGAAVLTRDEVLKKAGEVLQDDYYIMPSSIREVILVPARFGDEMESLDELVREINLKGVEPQEILSDKVFCFDREKNKLYEPKGRERDGNERGDR
mgnify:CR=1 FL=1